MNRLGLAAIGYTPDDKDIHPDEGNASEISRRAEGTPVHYLNEVGDVITDFFINVLCLMIRTYSPEELDLLVPPKNTIQNNNLRNILEK